MPITVQAIGDKYDSISGTPVNLTATTTQAGDILIAHIAIHSAADPGTITPPAGWTLVQAGVTSSTYYQRLYVFWFRATGNHNGQVFTFTKSLSVPGLGRLLYFRGCNTGAGVLNVSSISENGSSANVSFNSITTTVPDCMIVALSSAWNFKTLGTDTGALVGSATQYYNSYYGSSVIIGNTILKAAAGSTGVASYQVDYGPGISVGCMFALAPPVTIPTAPTLLTSSCVTGLGESDVAGAPTASASADVTSGTAPLTVNFTDRSGMTPTSWLWEFQDGTTSTSQNPSHTFTTAGTYAVRLTATNAQGSTSYQMTIVVLDAVVVTPPTSGVVVPVGSIQGASLQSLLGKIGYFAVDSDSHQVKIHGLDGAVLKTFGGVGTAAGKFYHPTTCSVAHGRQLLDRVEIIEE